MAGATECSTYAAKAAAAARQQQQVRSKGLAAHNWTGICVIVACVCACMCSHGAGQGLHAASPSTGAAGCRAHLPEPCSGLRHRQGWQGREVFLVTSPRCLCASRAEQCVLPLQSGPALVAAALCLLGPLPSVLPLLLLSRRWWARASIRKLACRMQRCMHSGQQVRRRDSSCVFASCRRRGIGCVSPCSPHQVFSGESAVTIPASYVCMQGAT